MDDDLSIGGVGAVDSAPAAAPEAPAAPASAPGPAAEATPEVPAPRDVASLSGDASEGDGSGAPVADSMRNWVNGAQEQPDTTQADAAAQPAQADAAGQTKDPTRGTGPAHDATASGYFPYNNKMEGGHMERTPPGPGQKAGAVNTIDDWNNNRHWNPKTNKYEDGRPPWVTLSGDKSLAGKNVSIDQFPGVPFRVMDSGSAFEGKGWNRFDIAVGSHTDSFRKNTARSHENQFNGPITLREFQ